MPNVRNTYIQKYIYIFRGQETPHHTKCLSSDKPIQCCTPKGKEGWGVSNKSPSITHIRIQHGGLPLYMLGSPFINMKISLRDESLEIGVGWDPPAIRQPLPAYVVRQG